MSYKSSQEDVTCRTKALTQNFRSTSITHEKFPVHNEGNPRLSPFPSDLKTKGRERERVRKFEILLRRKTRIQTPPNSSHKLLLHLRYTGALLLLPVEEQLVGDRRGFHRRQTPMVDFRMF